MSQTWLVSAAALLFLACPGGNATDAGFDAGSVPKGTLACTPATSTLRVGETVQLSVAGSDAGATAYRWSSFLPTVADVDSGGLVTALAPGLTNVVVETDTDHGVCAVRVLSLCEGIDRVNSWTGALSLDFAASANGSTSFALAHHADVTFFLEKDPSNPYAWIGQGVGTGRLDETEVISGGAAVEQSGNGAVTTVGDLTLTVDPSACTSTFEWLWAIDTTYTVDGASMPVPQVNVGDVRSAATPVPPGWSSAGLGVDAGFPAYGQAGGGAAGDAYLLLTQVATAYCAANPGPQGPASVTFTATPGP